jgi:WD40 repeat protein
MNKRISAFLLLFAICFWSLTVEGQSNYKFEYTGQKSVHKFGAEGKEILGGTPIITFVLFPNNDWLLFTPSGEFEGTDGALALTKINDGTKTEPCSKNSSKYTRGLASKTIPRALTDKFIARITKLTGKEVSGGIIPQPVVTVDMQGHSDQITDIAVTPDCKTLVSVSKDKTIRLWDIETGENVKTFRSQPAAGEIGSIYRLAISPDQTQILVGGVFDEENGENVGDIYAYDFNTGEITGFFSRSDKPTTALTFSKSGNLFISGSDNGRIYVWNKENYSKEIGSSGLFDDIKIPILQYENGISAVAISPDETKMVVSRFYRADPALISLADVLSGGRAKTNIYLNKHTREISSVAFSPDGNYILTADPREAHLWDKDGNYIRLFADIFGTTEGDITFSSDGTMVILGNDIYEFPSGKRLVNKTDFGERVNAIISNHIAVNVLDNNILLWDIKTGNPIRTLKSGQGNFNGIAFLDDGLQIALSSEFPIDAIGRPFNYDPKQIVSVFDFNSLRLNVEPLKDSVYNNLVFTSASGKLKRPAKTAEGEIMDEILIGSKSVNKDGSMGLASSFTYTPDGNVVIGTTFYLRMFDSNGNEIRKFEGQTGKVDALAISKDGKYLASLCTDRTVRVYDLKETPDQMTKIVFPVVTLFVSDRNEWVCYTKNQYYASSKRGGQFIGFLIDNGKYKVPKFYTFEQMDLAYNRPDQVIKALGVKNELLENAYYQAYLKRLKKNGLTEKDIALTFDGPELAILTKPQVVEISNPKIKLSAISLASTISHFDIFINDVYTSRSTLDGSKQKEEVEAEVQLTAGKNKIQVVAYDKLGQNSATETLRLFYKAKVEPKPDLFIVTLGVSDYINNDYDLRYAAKDANDVVGLFTKDKRFYGNVKTLALNNQNAVQENLGKAAEFLRQSKIDDQVILFVAGHGLVSDQLDWYFGAHDIDFNNPAGRGIAFESLENLFGKIPARKRLMLVDACHSGEVDKDEASLVTAVNTSNTSVKSRGFKTLEKKSVGLNNSFDLMQQFFTDLNKGTGAIIISSAGGAEFAFESPQWNNGVFTYAFLEGIKTGKADSNKDGQIMASELRDYVIETVKKLTSGKQTPTSRRENLEFDFRVW